MSQAEARGTARRFSTVMRDYIGIDPLPFTELSVQDYSVSSHDDFWFNKTLLNNKNKEPYGPCP